MLRQYFFGISFIIAPILNRAANSFQDNSLATARP